MSGWSDQVQAAAPELGPGGRVVGLGVGPGLPGAVEEPAGHPGQGRVDGQPAGRRHPVAEAVDGVADLLGDHLGRHVRRRVQAVHRHLIGRDPAGQLETRHDLGQLALPVGPGAGVPAGDHQVTEVERVLAQRGDVDHAGRRGRAQQRQQVHGEQEPGQVVHGEAELVAVGAGPPLPAVRLARADAGVADQHVQPPGQLPHLVAHPADLGQLGQVGADGARLAAAA